MLLISNLALGVKSLEIVKRLLPSNSIWKFILNTFKEKKVFNALRYSLKIYNEAAEEGGEEKTGIKYTTWESH